MAPVLRHCPCLRPENDDVRLLDYSHSNLEDVPNEVFSFERTLEELFLDANQIKDLPRPLFHCHGLRKLNLSDNEIQNLPPAIASLINLERLDISKNGILEIPDNIKGCKCLTAIDASVNPLGKLPEGFTFLLNLQELYLNDTFLEYLPANFGRLSHLKILELRENHLKLLPKSMARLTELCRLDIGQNDFAELPEVIGNLPRLTELWCDSNNLNCLPPFLGGLKKLTYLDASKNKIYEVADEIEGCISLSDLTLSSNRIKVLPDGLAHLRKITVLRVDENRLISVPDSIGNLHNLEELVLSTNNLQMLPISIGLLRNLRTLIADDNMLEEIPCEIGSCLKLTILSLRDNKLVVIPDELGHISALKVINLSGNLLQYLPFSIAKLPNLQALWLSENQNKPLIPLQSDTDRITGQKVLTCFMLPQVPLEGEINEVHNSQIETPDPVKGRHIIKFAFDASVDQPSKLVRAPTPYPKELKAHARHARNYALKKQGSKDSEGNEISEESSQMPLKTENLHATGATPDIMILPNVPNQESNSQVKEAVVSKPKSPLASPSKHERHYIPNVGDRASLDVLEIKPHSFLEQNPLQVSHALNEICNSDIAAKVLGRRDSRGDGSSSENTSTSATGSPKSTPDNLLSEGYGYSPKLDKDGHFKKNLPVSSKKDTWMRQRLLKQGSGDSDRGYRSDHEVYISERDQYAQNYHDGYASDWEAFLAKQTYSSPTNGPLQNPPQYSRASLPGDMSFRGRAEGQEIKLEGSQENFSYPWDQRFNYPEENDGAIVNGEYHPQINQAYEGYWQMDPVSGQMFPVYDMSHSYPPAADNPTYVYPRQEIPPAQMQHFYEDCDGYKYPTPNFFMPRMPSPNPVMCNNQGTMPRRLGCASPRLKRSQCLSVQAPLHGSPQEYHLVPHQAGTARPGGSPHPGRAPSPGVDNRISAQYSPQPYPKFPPSFQPQYSNQGFPITTQPVNPVHMPAPLPNTHPTYGNFQDTFPVYPTMPPPPRMKQNPYVMSTVDDSALFDRSFQMSIPGNHGPGYYTGNNLPEAVHSSYSHEAANNHDMFMKVQDAEYGVMSPVAAPYRSGSIPAHIQNIDNEEPVEVQHLNRSVPSINIIPSTSPPYTSRLTSSNGGWTDNSTVIPVEKSGKVASEMSNSAADTDERGNKIAPDEVASLCKSHVESEICKDINNRTLYNTELDASSSQNSDQNSYTVISPKPNKAPSSLNSSIDNNVVNSSETQVSQVVGDSQTAFRKVGGFQAVVPNVHSLPRKKSSTDDDIKLNNEASVGNSSLTEYNLQNVSMNQKTSSVSETPSQTLNSNLTENQNDNPKTKVQSGFVESLVNHLNKSANSVTNSSEINRKVLPSSQPKSHLNSLNSVKNESKSEPFFPKHNKKPGYAVQVLPSQKPLPPIPGEKIPPALPKKEKKSVKNTELLTNNKPTVFVSHGNQKDVPETKNPNTVNAVSHNPESGEPCNSYQNKIAQENSKNRKITGYRTNTHSPNHSRQNSEPNPAAQMKPNSKSDGNESGKQCSSDKRFQKVLPPLDKSFQLKPCSARKNTSQSDSSDSGYSNSSGNDVKIEEHCSDHNVNSQTITGFNLSGSENKSCKADSNVPPALPPKRSSACLLGGELTSKNARPENDFRNELQVKMPPENSEKESLSEMTPEIIHKINVNLVEVVKNINNENSDVLQKENMPDLLSRIIPNEKNEFIYDKDESFQFSKTKDELVKNSENLPDSQLDKSLQFQVPDSPKSPKRQSWFFGTHKNSLVFPVIISKNPELGFSIAGGINAPRNPGRPNDLGIYVTEVLAEGPANNLLRPGDKILQVDGTDFTKLDFNKALTVLRESGNTISLMVSRE
ncbi:erbin-like [Uloborus diversus]|uniref:erbin-like n=1 Tax=Uloborus diversus TaxID=327109 RepID=UPI0024096581|nr:erbin-like [Uloborus diversus]